jgi:two-component system NtrC family sensor kinase
MLHRKLIVGVAHVLLFCMIGISLFAQTAEMDSLHNLVAGHPQKDTIRVKYLNAVGLEARKSTAEVSYTAFMEALELSKSLKYKKGEGLALLGLGFYYRFKGETKPGLTYTMAALPIFKEIKDTISEITCYYNLATTYEQTANLEQAITVALEGLRLAELKENPKWLGLMNYQLGNLFQTMQDIEKSDNYFLKSMQITTHSNDLDGMRHALEGRASIFQLKGILDSAIVYFQMARELDNELDDPRGFLQNDLNVADIKEQQGKFAEAFALIRKNIPVMNKLGQIGYLSFAQEVLSRAHFHTGNYDSSLYYGLLSLHASQRSGRIRNSGTISKTIAEAYAQKGNYAEAYRYQLMFSKYMDSLNITEAVKRSAARQYSFELEKKQSQISLLTKNEELREKQSKQQKIVQFVTLAGLLIVIGFSIILWRNNRQKQKAYTRLEQQQIQLKATQTQLVQSEKMASLGELTAGIAHEIQNPLNFVNNFSEINKELIDELQHELMSGKIVDAISISNDIKSNEEKINHHGKRADAIVKGMLQHSRSSSGIKEPTDINALADEYLRLAYHGLRAKDKSFNATMVTDFDPAIGKINVLPQDMGRVILNLITNAFYSVSDKKRSAMEGYEPTVSVSTKKEKDKVLISVKDNGNGVPQKVVDKIFQPFFTTKPTGEGTGLGLSMSYDIITKGHGGELIVESQEGEYAIFKIILPV